MGLEQRNVRHTQNGPDPEISRDVDVMSSQRHQALQALHQLDLTGLISPESQTQWQMLILLLPWVEAPRACPFWTGCNRSQHSS